MARQKEIQKIYGYVDLTDEMQKWIKKQIMGGDFRLAEGWKVVPAHHRPNPTIQIMNIGYPDCEESNLYWFNNPQRVDKFGQQIREPLPIKSERDKDFFHEENEKFRKKEGFYRYKIFKSRKNFVEEFSVDYQDYVRGGQKAPDVRQPVFEDVSEDYDVRPVAVAGSNAVDGDSEYERAKRIIREHEAQNATKEKSQEKPKQEPKKAPVKRRKKRKYATKEKKPVKVTRIPLTGEKAGQTIAEQQETEQVA